MSVAPDTPVYTAIKSPEREGERESVWGHGWVLLHHPLTPHTHLHQSSTSQGAKDLSPLAIQRREGILRVWVQDSQVTDEPCTGTVQQAALTHREFITH